MNVRARGLIVGFLVGGAAVAGGAGKAQFVDYYASTSSLMQSLNAVASDVENIDVRGGAFADEDIDTVRERLVKVREGFGAVLTYDDHTTEINEGYLLYVDKMLLALILAKDNKPQPDAERSRRVAVLLDEAAALRARLNLTVQKDKKKYGLD